MRKLPPRFLLGFFNWFCHPDLKPYVEGDLIEIFQYHLKTKGVRKANWIFTKEVIKLIRPSMMKSMEGSYRLNYYGIFKNHIKTSFRNIRKHALFSMLNIAGLAISMAVGILAFLFQSELSSFDDFHANRDRIYRVTSSQIGGPHATVIKRATASCFIGNELKDKVSSVEEVAILVDDMRADLLAESEGMSIEGFYASTTFFKVFSFELISGDPKTALEAPNGIILTEKTAGKLFGDKNPIGQTLAVFENEFMEKVTVTGVLADPPINSHLRFDALVSFTTLDAKATVPYIDDLKNSPGELSDANVYVLLNDGKNAGSVEEMIPQMMAGFNKTIDHPIKHTLQPMNEFVTSNNFRGIVGPTFSKRKSLVMSGLALIVLLSACFNYMNLSMARATRRAKEVSIRKTNGASQIQIFTLFIIEALLLSVFALCLGFCLFFLIRPEFLGLPNESADGYHMFMLTMESHHYLQFLGFALIVGLLAGIVPALFHARLQAKIWFKGADKLKLYQGINIRTILIAIQFAFSVGLITMAVLIKNQYDFVLDYDHGYDTENILSVEINGDYIELLETACEQMPEITAVSKSSWVLGTGGENLKISVAKSADRSNSTPFLMNHVDKNYLNMHGISLLQGRGFSRDLRADERPKEIIVNESFLKALNLGTADKAITQQIEFYGSKLTIVGVIEEVVSIGLSKKIFEPFAFIQTNDKTHFTSLNLKINTNDIFGTIEKIENIYDPLDSVHPFEANFYNDMIAKGYESRKGTYLTVSFLAFLAIIISTLGLLGMAVFTVENRMKEISIRKVLGARGIDLSYLLSKYFLILIGIAGLVAIPVTVRIANQYLLNDFWDRASIGVFEVLSGFGIVFIIGTLTIGWQLHQVMAKNPADLLHDE